MARPTTTTDRKQDAQQEPATGAPQPDLDRIWRDWDAYDAAKAERLKRTRRGEWQ